MGGGGEWGVATMRYMYNLHNNRPTCDYKAVLIGTGRGGRLCHDYT